MLQIRNIPVRVTRKSIKNMYLRINPATGEARITAPLRASRETIIAFSNAHSQWLVEKMASLAPTRAQDTLPEILEIWGASYRVKIDENPTSSINLRLEAGQLYLAAPHIPRIGEWQTILGHFLRNLVLKEAPPILRAWSAKLDLPVPALGVRRMKRRWGTCYPYRKRILLNSELAFYPPKCLEQVIVHELLHFYEPNHGKAFKKRMDMALPDWRFTAGLLKKQI